MSDNSHMHWEQEMKYNDKIEVLKQHPANKHLKLIYQWIKAGEIDYVIFEALINYAIFCAPAGTP